MTELEQYIHSYFGISKTEIAEVASLFHEEKLSKNEYFTRTGEYCKSLSFVKSGYLRVYNNHDGNEITQWISAPGSFVTDLSSMVFGTVSRWNIQALTEIEFYTISREAYNDLGTQVGNWDKLEKLFLAKCFLTLEDRVFSFLSMTAEERFSHLYETQKDLFNQVPLQYIASMLGMTPETLSRIRKKLIS